jgi:cystathionine beta-lyase/cystathionine gamma-synthase
MEEKKLSIDTQLIHAGVEPDPSTGAIMTPIYQTSTFVQSTPGHHKGYEYARSQNPTRQALEKALAIIENGKYATAGRIGFLLKYLKATTSISTLLI